jgi:ATP-dependent DNA helicase RecQ
VPSRKQHNSAHLKLQEITTLARERFGIRHFRPGQREILQAVLQGKNVLGIMPTGAGKSLCYQLPALLLPKATVVVSPLIALMKDQQEELNDINVDSAKLDSTVSPTESHELLTDIRKGERPIAFLTPERLEKPEVLEHLRKGGLSLLVIDEAHCISQWGHDFRPAYLYLRDAIQKLGGPPVLALTATATTQVIEDIIHQLAIHNAEIIKTAIRRDNLRFEVVRTVNSEAKLDGLRRVLSEERGTGIIYCATVKHCNQVYEWLRDSGESVTQYHGKMRIKERNQNQALFMNGKVHAVVATKAFGLGINKPDVRFVLHYDLPDSVESYYQEAGRAGRDGGPARCILFFQLEDKRVQSYFLGRKYSSSEDSLRIYSVLSNTESSIPAKVLAQTLSLQERKTKVILAYLQGAGIVTRTRTGFRKVKNFSTEHDLQNYLKQHEERFRDDRERLEEMLAYGQTTQCRQCFLDAYFSEDATEPCGVCDNCRALQNGELTQSIQEPIGNEIAAVNPELAMALELANTRTSDNPEWLESVTSEPASETNNFQSRQRVRHRRFGTGQVVNTEPDRVTVRFDDGRVKKVQAMYLKPVANGTRKKAS